ncbi:MAG: hypothetical protein WBP12_01065 [Candidatus Saccharimonas sp.]
MLNDNIEVSIQASDDTFISTPVDGQTLIYSNTKWRNGTAGASSFTAAKNTAASGNLTLTAGTSASLTKFAATLSANRTITLAGTTAGASFELSFIETDFNGYSITITNGTFSHAFSYPTFVRYVYIAGAWERVL